MQGHRALNMDVKVSGRPSHFLNHPCSKCCSSSTMAPPLSLTPPHFPLDSITPPIYFHAWSLCWHSSSMFAYMMLACLVVTGNKTLIHTNGDFFDCEKRVNQNLIQNLKQLLDITVIQPNRLNASLKSY